MLSGSLSALLIARFGGFSVGAGFDHKHVDSAATEEDEDERPSFEFLP